MSRSTATAEVKLKPCPFCGSKKVAPTDGTYEHPPGTINKTHSVLCGTCNATGPDTALGKDWAAFKWNERPQARRRKTKAPKQHPFPSNP